MTDTTLTPNEPVPQEPKSINMQEQIEKEQEAGRAAAEGNAAQQDKARESREQQTMNAREWVSRARAAGDKDAADRAEKIRSMVEDHIPPPGPGLPHVDKTVIAATMDPNNPVLNPDMSEFGRTLGLPPGARVPEPVLPQDTIQTQFASKPPTEAHGEEGEEVAKGLPEPIYPPAGSQPTLELTEEQQAELDESTGRSGDQRRVTDQRDENYGSGTQTNPPEPGQNT